MSEFPTHDEPDRPIPPRFWWLKRLSSAFFLLLVTLVVVCFSWDRHSRRALAAFIVEHRALGEAMLVDDIPTPSVPDHENGAKLILAAAALSEKLDVQNAPGIRDFCNLSAVRAFQPLAFHAIDQRAEILCELLDLEMRRGTDWGIVHSHPLINLNFTHLSDVRTVEKLICAAALVEHERLNGALALDYLGAGLEVGAQLRGSHHIVMIDLMVAVACDALVSNSVHAIAPTLVVDDHSSTAASRAQVVALIRKLLDESKVRQAARHAFLGERLWTLDTFKYIESSPGAAAGAIGIPMSTGALKFPAMRLDCLRVANRQSRMADAMLAETYPAAGALSAYEVTESANPVSAVAKWFSLVLESNLQTAAQLHYRGLTERRMAAVALAVRLFVLDHGRLPESLAELVPDYLPSVPRDALAADDRPIGFVTSDGLPRLYSVGMNGLDDGGKIEFENGFPEYSRDEIIFFLCEPPMSPHADLYGEYRLFQAFEDDQDIETDGGQEDTDAEQGKQADDGPG